jgi:hypothetical protein
MNSGKRGRASDGAPGAARSAERAIDAADHQTPARGAIRSRDLFVDPDEGQISLPPSVCGIHRRNSLAIAGKASRQGGSLSSAQALMCGASTPAVSFNDDEAATLIEPPYGSLTASQSAFTRARIRGRTYCSGPPKGDYLGNAALSRPTETTG